MIGRMAILPEPEWNILFNKLQQRKGLVMIIGATDAGKSTLAKYLISKAVSRNVSVCLIDADVGQSSLGLPGTICSKIISSEEDLLDYSYQKMSYAGTINPATNIFEIIDIVAKMSTQCRIHMDISLIDTSGLVNGELGKRLKTEKVRAVNPDHLIAIQRGNELEHILSGFTGTNIHRIRASGNIQARTLAMRIKYRTMKYREYFQRDAMKDFILYSEEAQYFYKGKQFSVFNRYAKKDTIVGLNHNDDTLALGILEDMSERAITFSSPLDSIRHINKVVFGDIRYAKDQS